MQSGWGQHCQSIEGLRMEKGSELKAVILSWQCLTSEWEKRPLPVRHFFSLPHEQGTFPLSYIQFSLKWIQLPCGSRFSVIWTLYFAAWLILPLGASESTKHIHLPAHSQCQRLHCRKRGAHLGISLSHLIAKLVPHTFWGCFPRKYFLDLSTLHPHCHHVCLNWY